MLNRHFLLGNMETFLRCRLNDTKTPKHQSSQLRQSEWHILLKHFRIFHSKSQQPVKIKIKFETGTVFTNKHYCNFSCVTLITVRVIQNFFCRTISSIRRQLLMHGTKRSHERLMVFMKRLSYLSTKTDSYVSIISTNNISRKKWVTE